jgi:hypothetical protein
LDPNVAQDLDCRDLTQPSRGIGSIDICQ